MIDFILRPIRRRFGKDRMFYAAIDDMFGFIPHNIELYKLALIHKSASVTLDDGRQINNERLEFLGDAVIESVTSDYLFIEFPDQNEGFLTQLRSKMVSRQSLNEVAKRLKLDTHVITHSSASFSQKHIYGDAFEAMMGAIYLDQGYDFVNRLLINRIFGDYLRTGALLEEETDFKSRLIEWCQKNHHTIRFITTHDKNYSSAHPICYCKVLIDDIEAGYGSGDSKKEAEQQAAFSVSQGFKEEDCAKLLDKLDAIDKGFPQPAAQQSQAAAPQTGDSGDSAVTEAAETAKAPVRNRPRRARKSTAAENDTVTENAVTEDSGHENGAADTVAEDNAKDTAAVAERPATTASVQDEPAAPAEAAGPAAAEPAEDSARMHAAAEHAPTAAEGAADAAPADETAETANSEAKSRPSRRSRRKGARTSTAPNAQGDNAVPAAETAEASAEGPATSVTESQATEPAAADGNKTAGTITANENAAETIMGSDAGTDAAPRKRPSRSAAKRRSAKSAEDIHDTLPEGDNTVPAEHPTQEAAPKPKAKRRNPGKRTAGSGHSATADNTGVTTVSGTELPDNATRPARDTEAPEPTPVAGDNPDTGADSDAVPQQ